MRDDVAFGSIPELGRLLRARKLSSTDLTELYLERLERLGPRSNCVVPVTPERALAEAPTADRELRAGRVRGPLHGIPYGVKDLLAAKGYPTTWGAEPYRAQTFDEDATVVARLGAAGGGVVAEGALVGRGGGVGGRPGQSSFSRARGEPPSRDDSGGGGRGGGGGGRGFRIGVRRGVIDAVQGEVAETSTTTLDVLRGIAEIVPDVEPPDLPFGVVGGTIIAAEGVSAFDDLLEGNRLKDLTAPEDRTGGYGALAISARDYLRALRVRRLMGRAYDELLKRFDAIAPPTRTTVASPLDKAFRDAYPDVRGGVSMIGSSNVVGVPAISVPNGFGLAGLPTGLSLVARAFDEVKLVRIARAYQARTDWHTRRPEEA